MISTELSTRTPFDYSRLPVADQPSVQDAAAEIRTLLDRAAQDIGDIGQRLLEVKARVGHGFWGEWLRKEFGWSADTAQNFMKVADKFGIIPNLSIPATALYLLAAPSTPEPARIEALARAGSGERITVATARALITSHRVGQAEPAQAAAVAIDGDENYTPVYIADAARLVMGSIDLDPASCALAQQAVLATTFYSKAQDGLLRPWWGRVWLNPPFSKPLPFITKAIAEYDTGNITAAVVLTNNGTETRWGQALLSRCPVCLVGAHEDHGSRIGFWQKHPNEERSGNRYAQMICYLGNDAPKFGEVFSQFGVIKL